MTDNSIAFPLSSVATKSSLEKLSSAKEFTTSNNFQSVLDNYVSQSNNNDKPIKNDSSKAQSNIIEDHSEVIEHSSEDTSDSNETSLKSTESAQANSQSSPTANKKQPDSAISDDQQSLQAADRQQDGNNTQANSLVNIIAAQTFNNRLVQQEKNASNSIEAVQANAIATNSLSADTKNTLQSNSDSFASQLSASKATTDKAKLPDTNIDTQLSDQLKLVNTLETASVYAGQIQANNLTTSVNSIPSYTIANNFYSDNWNTSTQQQVLSLRHNNIDNATLILNPEHLGPIHVSIQIDAQSQTSIQFWSQNADVRQALRDGLPNLNSLFQESGLQLGSADVSSQQNSSDNSHPKFNQFNSESAEMIDDSSMENQINTSLSVKNLVNVYI